MNDVHNENGTPKLDQIIICRFAALVTRISTRVEDQAWFYRVHECLARQIVTYKGDILALNRLPSYLYYSYDQVNFI